jgi:hypothetical protein
MDVVGIIAVEDEELGEALAGEENETAGLVGEILASALHDGGEAMVSRETGWCGRREKVIVVVMVARERDGGGNKGRGRGGVFGFGRLDIFLGLIEIPFGGGNGIGGVFR